MKYIIIGLGNYGQALAKELTSLHHEVIGVDSDPANVELVNDAISTSFILDATNEQALSVLPIRSVDVVIVAIGESFSTSVKVVALLKKNKAKRIYARALDDVHKSVLAAFDIDLILTPELDAARSLVQLLDLHVHVESLQLDNEYYVMKFKIPESLIGFAVNDLLLEKKFNLTLLSLLNSKKVTNRLGISIADKSVLENISPEYILCSGDYLVCYGKYRNFISFWRSI